MFKKVTDLYRSIRSLPQIHLKLDELMWADIYRETIKDIPWLKDLSISPGDMAANYSFLYLLARILKENKIESILEFGLGQSTRFIESFTASRSYNVLHDVIEDSKDWFSSFDQNRKSKYNTFILNKISIFKYNTNIQIYENLNQYIRKKYDLYVIDGPKGLPTYSRFDICEIANTFKTDDQFIIIMDDYQRKGEQETISKLKLVLNNNGIKFYTKVFKGSKSQMLLVTERYKFAISF